MGIVVKRFANRTLPPGCLIALKGEAGYQADTLAPGIYFGYWPWQYKIQKVPMTQVPAGQIALVVAADGTAIPAERILGRVVACDSFQDARKFLEANGERGRQLGFLTAGSYRINTALFTIITVDRASDFGLNPASLMVQQIRSEAVGIVTTLDGQPISPGEIAGPVIPGHDNFQDAQAFLSGGGSRGLQEQILLSGSWNLNPWFVQIDPVPMLEIPIGYVGVVVSYVGAAVKDVSGAEFKHGDLVEPGHKGVSAPHWRRTMFRRSTP